MIHSIPKPDISPDFTIEDIHKIREWHYEILKDATSQERAKFYGDGAKEFQDYCAERKRQKAFATT
jgi:hypothetical protein